MAGIALSIGNPYFLLWWATVGLGLVLSAARFGALGLVLFIVLHWLCDLVWYTLLSSLSFRGVRTFGSGLYRMVSIICGLAMLFFGGAFILGSLKLLTA
jgi:threonine/homoserine/homoserine lactone efflux protein